MSKERKQTGFTLVELMVVITVIIMVTGMTIPMVMSYFEKEKLPRAAKILGANIRLAQTISMNYNTKTYFETAPGTDNTMRVWAFAGLCPWPTRTEGAATSWDKTSKILVTEARRVPRAGGSIRPVPINRYSLEPVNAQGSMSMSLATSPGYANWEFGELSYSHFGISDYKNAPGSNPWWGLDIKTKSAGSFMGLKYSDGAVRTSAINVYSPIEIQVMQGSEKALPRGVGVDTVNYVSYMDFTGDGMPDGNPLALIMTDRAQNPVEPLWIPSKGGVALSGDLYKDSTKYIPKAISATLAFSKEGTLRKNLSLRYYSKHPVASREYFTSGIGSIENIHYGFIVYDKANPTATRMMVEVTGAGQIRSPFGVYSAKPDKPWGGNFDVKSQYGE